MRQATKKKKPTASSKARLKAPTSEAVIQKLIDHIGQDKIPPELLGQIEIVTQRQYYAHGINDEIVAIEQTRETICEAEKEIIRIEGEIGTLKADKKDLNKKIREAESTQAEHLDALRKLRRLANDDQDLVTRAKKVEAFETERGALSTKVKEVLFDWDKEKSLANYEQAVISKAFVFHKKWSDTPFVQDRFKRPPIDALKSAAEGKTAPSKKPANKSATKANVVTATSPAQQPAASAPSPIGA